MYVCMYDLYVCMYVSMYDLYVSMYDLYVCMYICMYVYVNVRSNSIQAFRVVVSMRIYPHKYSHTCSDAHKNRLSPHSACFKICFLKSTHEKFTLATHIVCLGYMEICARAD